MFPVSDHVRFEFSLLGLRVCFKFQLVVDVVVYFGVDEGIDAFGESSFGFEELAS